MKNIKFTELVPFEATQAVKNYEFIPPLKMLLNKKIRQAIHEVLATHFKEERSSSITFNRIKDSDIEGINVTLKKDGYEATSVFDVLLYSKMPKKDLESSIKENLDESFKILKRCCEEKPSELKL